jgi:hypothetical protein
MFNTVVHLRWVQVYYQLYYKVRNALINRRSYATLKGYTPVESFVKFHNTALLGKSVHLTKNADSIEFTFLNVKQEFPLSKIDWEFMGEGKLWNYNLNYFEFLFHSSLTRDSGQKLIEDFCYQFNSLESGLEPYPLSLRGINWIKFMSIHEIRNAQIDKCLYQQYQILSKNLEYHILGNHLLENAFSLLFGAYYFKNANLYDVSLKILEEQLEEQILNDGAHFERSPMYHQIILFRVLDSINLLRSNDWKQRKLLDLLEEKASKMLCWLECISSTRGDIPMFQDSAIGIAPSTNQLINYANELNIHWESNARLLESGYRKLKTGALELIANIGEVAPSYQPGHAHADEFNFMLYSQGEPIIVDTGISTYEKNVRRQNERATNAHNCVTLNNKNSSNVWGGFRVAKRAEVKVFEDKDNLIRAQHNGYAHVGARIERSFESDESGVKIIDCIQSNGNYACDAKLNLHFHPNIDVKINENTIFADKIRISLYGFESVELKTYEVANGFNRLNSAPMVSLKPSQKTKILIHNAD